MIGSCMYCPIGRLAAQVPNTIGNWSPAVYTALCAVASPYGSDGGPTHERGAGLLTTKPSDSDLYCWLPAHG